MSFHLYSGNRLEVLADRLAERMSRDPPPPFIPDTVVVQNFGMARWLKLELARRLGACIQVEFPFPRIFLERLASDPTALESEGTAYDRASLEWHLYACLDMPLQGTGFEVPRDYLRDGDPVKRAQLATQLAHLYDQYLVYRPDLIAQWSSDGGGHWQAALWLALRARLGHEAPSERIQSLATRLRATTTETSADKLPHRLFLFGVAALPPGHLECFAALAKFREVSAFVLQPCAEWWGDISSPSEQQHVLRRVRRNPGAAAELHLEAGHPLLAAWGAQGRDFLRLWQEHTEIIEHDEFVPPEGSSLLSEVQRDLLELRGDPVLDAPRRSVAVDDDSLLVHSCHSPLRELEILYDRILDWLERDPALEPRDIVVMAPDLGAYAPLIEAVFGTPERSEWRIPYSVADRHPRKGAGVKAGFLRALALAGTRLEVSDLMELLEFESIRGRFEIDAADVEILWRWVADLRVDFGRDGEHRRQSGLTGTSARTWRHGLQRLLAGQAMRLGEGELFLPPKGDPIAPTQWVEGGTAELAGRFCEFVELVCGAVEQWEGLHTPSEWTALLHQCVTHLFEAEASHSADLASLRQILSEWGRRLLAAGTDERLPLAAVLPSLVRELDSDRTSAGFLSGGITFCDLKPLRSLPFRAIGVLGMNGGAFPRQPTRLSFDLMLQEVRPGDRSSREDDRYLLLETLVSARQWLHFSYVGQSSADNSTIPPAAVLRQLTDYLDANFVRAGFPVPPKCSGAAWVVSHRLHGFSPAYFAADSPGGFQPLFSYSRIQAQVARIARLGRRPPRPFIPAEFTSAPAVPKSAETEDLVQFFRNPIRAFLRRRLDLDLMDPVLPLESEDGWKLSSLEKSRLLDRLARNILVGKPWRDLAGSLSAEGVIPPGTVGELLLSAIGPEADAYAARLSPYFTPGMATDSFSYSARAEELKISGICHLHPGGVIVHRRGGLTRGEDCLALWVELLAAWACGIDQLESGLLITPVEIFQWRRPADPLGEFQRFIEYYQRGLLRPARYFPRASWDWALKRDGSDDNLAKARAAASETWLGNGRTGRVGEMQSPWIQLAFGHETDPLNEEFEAMADAWLGGLLNARKAI